MITATHVLVGMLAGFVVGWVVRAYAELFVFERTGMLFGQAFELRADRVQRVCACCFDDVPSTRVCLACYHAACDAFESEAELGWIEPPPDS